MLPGPYVASAQWTDTRYGRTLEVTPTEAGRTTAGPSDGDTAWSEVLVLQPAADSPGMRDQFRCHFDYARVVAPAKPTWNLEPWRPVVDAGEMLAARCNPGGPEV